MKELYRDGKIIATMIGKSIKIEIVGAGNDTVNTTNGKIEARPVTNPRYLEALAKKGLDPSCRVMLGNTCIPAETSKAILDAFAAEYVSSDYEIMAEKLGKREAIQREIQWLGEEQYESERRSTEHACEHGFCLETIDNSTKIAEAKNRLIEYDAAHPEVVAEVAKRKEESIQRAMWN